MNEEEDSVALIFVGRRLSKTYKFFFLFKCWSHTNRIMCKSELCMVLSILSSLFLLGGFEYKAGSETSITTNEWYN